MKAIDQERLLVKIARLYFEQDLTQAEISQRLRLSRQRVQRLLQRARERGIVRISIRPVMGVFAALEEDIERRFGLQEAVIVETTAYEDQPVVAQEVGAAAVEYLRRVLQSHDRIVISWGGSLLGLVNALSANPQTNGIEDIMVIQGLGGLGDPNRDVHASDLTRRLAQVLGGQAALLHAPGVAGSRSAADTFFADPYVLQVLEQGRGATLAIMGIGAPRSDSILIREGQLVTWPELESLMNAGAVGDINLRYFDQRGQAISSDLDNRVIGLTLDEIRHIKRVVGIAGGAAKLKAIRAALEGALVNVLVTDHVTAGLLLEGNGSGSRQTEPA